MIPRVVKCLGLVAAVLFLQACVTTYVPLPGEKMATVRTVGFGTTQMCKDGKMYWPPQAAGDSKAVSVPAGQRLTVGAHLVSDGYQVIHYCRPFLSFVPVEGRSYVLNSALTGEGRCFVELVRDDADSRTGVAVESSVAGAACSPR